MPKHKEARITPKEQAQSVAYIGGLIAFFIAYLWAEAALALRPHPYHWVTAFGIATLIGVAAYGLTIWRLKRRAQK
jgi:ABC-type antimicrobial peptide transport system permease subunit